MTITGNVKFFGRNYIDSSCTFSFTTANTASADMLYDNEHTQRISSIGSNDASNEIWTITFQSARTFDRLFIGNHNIKSGNIQYWNGSSYVNFSTAISWSNNTDIHNYYEFNAITTTAIRLTMSTTQTANDQKRVGELRAFSELGTVLANPKSIDIEYREKSVKRESAIGGSIYAIFGIKFSATLEFSDADTTDIALIRTLKYNATSFYIYLCGGQTGYTQDGFRIQDMYLVNYVKAFNPNPKNNLLNIGSRVTLEVLEV